MLGDKDRNPSHRVSPDLKNGTARAIRSIGGAMTKPILPSRKCNVSADRTMLPDRRKDRAFDVLALILEPLRIKTDACARLKGEECAGVDETGDVRGKVETAIASGG